MDNLAGKLIKNFTNDQLKHKNEYDNEKLLSIALDCAKITNEKKADKTVLLDVSTITPVADFFIIASADTFIQLRALSDYIETEISKHGFKRINPKNPFNETSWLLSDYGFLVVHLFTNTAREYYNLEKFWHDAKVIYEGD